MVDINRIYSIVQDISNKYQSGYIGPDQFNNSFNLAQKQYFHQLLEDLQGWDANRKRIRLPMGNGQQVIQKVAPFIVKTTLAVPGSGMCPKPPDLVNLLAIRDADNMNRIWRVEHDRLAAHLSSVIDAPDESPVFTEYDIFYQVFPLDIGNVNIDYLKTPPDALWAYTLVNGRPVYDQPNSTQPLWGDNEMTDIIIRVLFMFGISVQASQLVQYYGSVKSDGQ